MGIAKVEDGALKRAVASSVSMAQMLQAVGVRVTGGNYSTAKKRISSLGLDTSHWLGQASNRGRTFTVRDRYTLEEILVENSPYSDRRQIKKKLVRAGLLSERCSGCGLSDWMGQPITLQLDHINGVSDDHRLENLRLLCPNCHSQTPTFSGRNRRKQPEVCPDCGGVKGYRSKRCQPCSVVARYGKVSSSPVVPESAGERSYRSDRPVSAEDRSRTCTPCKTEGTGT